MLKLESGSLLANPSPFKSAHVVLSIAGSDNTAGAGIQADIKTGAAFGVYVATAVTAITVQGGTQPVHVYPVTTEQLSQQIDRVLCELPVAAIKLGMLANEELLVLVSEKIAKATVPVVVDPVLTASAGGELLQSSEVAKFYERHIFPYATLVTPNLAESATLTGLALADDESGMIEQATQLLSKGAKAVLLKGGHSQLRLATDYLVTSSDGVIPYSNPWLQKRHTHGSGCTLATGIAAGLAQGLALPQAVAAAKSFIQGAIEHAERLQLTEHNGPVHHFYQYW